MKKLSIILLTMSAALTIQSCSNAPKDSTAKADSTNQRLDSTNKKDPASWGQEISGEDAEFAVAAANGGMAEVELGALAQEKGQNAQVKDFGSMMIKDHSKVNEELKALAKSKNITLPDSLNNEERNIKNKLSAKTDADFDKAYVQAMVDDHQKDIKDFEQADKIVKYPEMKAFIEKTLPVLKMHLAAIQKIQGQMK